MRLFSLDITVRETGNAFGGELGCYEPGASTITLRKDLAPWLKGQVFLHELCHAIVVNSGLKYTMEEEEIVVEAFANGIHGFMRDNPDVVARLSFGNPDLAPCSPELVFERANSNDKEEAFPRGYAGI